MGVLDDYLVNPGISLLDKTRIQAQVGREKADAIVTKALRDWSSQVFAGIGAGIEGPLGRKFAKMDKALAEATLQEVSVDMHRRDKEAVEFDITSCHFADFFRSLNEPELGALLVCATDIDIAAAGGD